ncbi:MAG: NAD(P)H-dependent oxidoreductase [Rickettsiales bacterium]|jgi:putative NADPH-quinone reductase|nr:NAD(P)H-dependent oxidoreductase [Rickettsiales bacterium]
MTKRILVIDSNPSKFSLTACLAEEYEINARKAGFEVEMLVLRDLTFDPILHFGYSRHQKLEPDLEKSQELLRWCSHLVILSPVWWYGPPALLKGFLDRVLLPEFAFRVQSNPVRAVERMLAGRTATLIYTYGGPRGNMETDSEDPFALQLKSGILYFCGFSDIKTFPLYDTIGFKNIKRRQKFIEDVARMGAAGE